MKKYKVSGTDKVILLKKVAEKLNTEVSRIAHNVLEESNGKVVLEVWIKENIKDENIKDENIKEVNKKEEEDFVENKIELNVSNEGVYIKINKGKVDFNEVINFIAEKDIEAPYMEKISEAYENRGKKIKIAEYYEGLYIPSKIEVVVSEDKMKAYIEMTEPKGMNLPKIDEIKEKLKQEGIIYGIREELIFEALKSKKFNIEIIVAEGKKAIDGENAKIKYYIKSIEKKNNLKPMMLENGKVDFKNLDIIENVEAGAILAEKIPPQKGVEGINVYGEKISAKEGKEINLVKGKNTSITEDGKKIISNISGMVSYKEKKIDVLNTFVVDNVGIGTGNIDFVGNVIVKGDIMPDYQVKATGNVEVKGNVEKAEIISEGDVIIRGSFFGKGVGKIKSLGDVILNFAEAIIIETEGNVIVNEAIMNSKVFCEKKITVIDRKGVIIGGEIKAAEGIEAINIGSHHAVKTDIEVGSNPKILEELKKMEEDNEETTKKMQQIEKNITLLSKLKSSGQLGDDKKELFEQLIKAKFSMTKHINDLKEKIEEYNEKSQGVKTSTVDIHGVCYPGIKIKIRKGTYFVKEEIQNARFYYENGDVKFTSLV